jgi:hypothetical protein
MTKFIITTLKLGIGNPHRQTSMLFEHPTIDLTPQEIAKLVGASSESADPQLFAQFIGHAIDCIFETAIAMGVLFNVPSLIEKMEGVGIVVGRVVGICTARR